MSYKQKCGTCGLENQTKYHINACRLKAMQKEIEELKGQKKLKDPAADMQKADADPQEKGSTFEKPEVIKVKAVPKKDPEPPKENSYVCDSCGGQLAKGQKYCAGCGTELSW